MKDIPYFIVGLLLLLAACTGSKHGNVQKADADSLKAKYYELLGDDPEQALSFVDSMEHAEVLSEGVANLYRAQAYSEQYQPRVSEMYALRALKDERLKKEDRNKYYFLYSLLINSAANVGNTEQALKYALEALSVAKRDGGKHARNYIPDFQVAIANSQFRLNRIREANANYERAWTSYEEILKKAKSFSWFYPEFMLCVDAINDNTNTDSIQISMHWLPRMLSTYERMVATEDIPDFVRDNCHADVEMVQAKLLQAAGRHKEAEQHYRAFRQTEFATTAIGQKSAAAYLESVGNWHDLAQSMEACDTFYVENASLYSMDYLNNVLARRYRAERQLQREEAALKTGDRIVGLLDSVQEYTQRDQAAKLAVVYETQEKEQKIAEQEADLIRQRFIAMAIAFALVAAFFIIYTIHRLRAARRLAEVSAQKERIESELRIARDIQMSMVPSEFPTHEGLDLYALMTPAREVGGDLYDCLLKDHQLYFCVGDVSGKGVPASLFMAQTLRLFRAFAKRGYRPDTIACRINDELAENNQNGMFVTMFIGLVDLANGHLDYCNCGHNPPVLGKDFLQMEPNVPIGLWEGVNFAGEEIADIRRKTLFVYTDGLNEAENKNQQQFGDERMLKVIREKQGDTSRQLIEKLSETVESHRQGAEPNDDLTMLSLKVQ